MPNQATTMPWLSAARGKPSRSASAIVVDSAHGRHDLRIDGATFAAGALVAPVGELLKSSPFTVGGHRWRVLYYPNGDRAESAGHISLYLSLDEDVAGGEEVTALFAFTLVAEKRGAFFLNWKKKKQVASKQATEKRSFRSKGGNKTTNWGWTTFVNRDAMSKLVARDGGSFTSFTVTCQFVVINGFHTEKAGAPKAMSNHSTTSIIVPPPDLHRHLGHLLETGKGSDVVFNVAGETFAAHRLVLAARSPVFDAELFSEMRESDAASGAVVRIDDMDPRAFQALLWFAYTDSLPEMKEEDACAMYQHLLVAADRYGMDRLKLVCEDKLCKYIGVATAATILTLAEQHRCDGLKKACLDFVGDPGNLKAVVASDGFDHLSTSCPSINKKLIVMLAS